VIDDPAVGDGSIATMLSALRKRLARSGPRILLDRLSGRFYD
jgi:hypothetical protein